MNDHNYLRLLSAFFRTGIAPIHRECESSQISRSRSVVLYRYVINGNGGERTKRDASGHLFTRSSLAMAGGAEGESMSVCMNEEGNVARYENHPGYVEHPRAMGSRNLRRSDVCVDGCARAGAGGRAFSPSQQSRSMLVRLPTKKEEESSFVGSFHSLARSAAAARSHVGASSLRVVVVVLGGPRTHYQEGGGRTDGGKKESRLHLQTTVPSPPPPPPIPGRACIPTAGFPRNKTTQRPDTQKGEEEKASADMQWRGLKS